MSRLRKKNPSTRLNLAISLDLQARRENLRDTTGADSLAEVVRRALQFYEFFLEKVTAGAKVMVEDGQGQKEIIFPEARPRPKRKRSKQ